MIRTRSNEWKFRSGYVYLRCDLQLSDSNCESCASNYESSDCDQSPVKKKSTKRYEKETDKTFKSLSMEKSIQDLNYSYGRE